MLNDIHHDDVAEHRNKKLTKKDKKYQPLASMNKYQTMPEAQRTQGIDTLTWIISPAK